MKCLLNDRVKVWYLIIMIILVAGSSFAFAEKFGWYAGTISGIGLPTMCVIFYCLEMRK